LATHVSAARQHRKVQLGTVALPGLPADTEEYLKTIETVVAGLRRVAKCWEDVTK